MTDLQNEVLEDKDFDTILAEDIEFSGTLSFEKPFLIRGRLKGEITAQDVLMIDANAVVEAHITAPRVIVRGVVTGNITADQGVELAGGGTVKGNIKTPLLSIEAGCLFNGLCTMERNPDEHTQ